MEANTGWPPFGIVYGQNYDGIWSHVNHWLVHLIKVNVFFTHYHCSSSCNNPRIYHLILQYKCGQLFPSNIAYHTLMKAFLRNINSFTLYNIANKETDRDWAGIGVTPLTQCLVGQFSNKKKYATISVIVTGFCRCLYTGWDKSHPLVEGHILTWSWHYI